MIFTDRTFQKAEILIVDDNILNLKLIASILKARHYQVRTLSSVLTWQETLEKSSPDLILLDIMMPVRSGYDLCRSLKQDRRFADIPVIFLTSLNDSASIIKCFHVGAADYLSKPVNPQELFARIETHLSLKINMEKLREAQKELERFDQMISHDLKSPIRMISRLTGFLEEYREKIDDPDYREILNGIRQKAEEVTNVMEKYSELSKLSRIGLQIEPVDLDPLVKQVFQENPESAKADICAAGLPVVQGDRLLVKYVFSNLVSNALKFSRGSCPPRIKIGSQKIENGSLVFVKDNGVGFNPKYAANIFKMFTRLHSQKEFEGTGTGLAIVKKIMDLHGGGVWIDAEEGKGATVFLTFPD